MNGRIARAENSCSQAAPLAALPIETVNRYNNFSAGALFLFREKIQKETRTFRVIVDYVDQLFL